MLQGIADLAGGGMANANTLRGGAASVFRERGRGQRALSREGDDSL